MSDSHKVLIVDRSECFWGTAWAPLGQPIRDPEPTEGRGTTSVTDPPPAAALAGSTSGAPSSADRSGVARVRTRADAETVPPGTLAIGHRTW